MDNLNRINRFKQRVKLLKECFPDTWKRKTLAYSIFLIFRTDDVIKDGKVVGLLTEKGEQIVFLAVTENYWGEGISDILLQRSNATYAWIRKDNKPAFPPYLRNGFRRGEEKSTLLGRRIKMER